MNVKSRIKNLERHTKINAGLRRSGLRGGGRNVLGEYACNKEDSKAIQDLNRGNMNIFMRLKKLEAAGPDPNICKCPDAIVYAATPYFKTCCQCEKPIDLKTWSSWTVIEPSEPECTEGAEDGINCAFALKRREVAEEETS